MTARKSVLLIVTGGIAAYKTLELVRRLVERDIAVTPVLTEAGAAFVTPLSLAALAGNKVYQDLFSLTDETEMGHIELSRQADLVVVAPATADCLAKLAGGLANDLASTLLLAAIEDFFTRRGQMAGRRALVTSGPTFEPSGRNLSAVNRGTLAVTPEALEYFVALYDAGNHYADEVLRRFFADQ